MTTTTPRRPEPATAPAAGPRRVEDLLRELTYVLHVTRKLPRPLAQPARPARGVRYEHTSAFSLA
jgi:hypothetical protein